MQYSGPDQRMEQLRDKQQWSASDAQYLLDAWKASGERLSQFARRVKIGQERLRWWSKRLGIKTPASSGNTDLALRAFVPVVVKSEALNRARDGAAAVLLVEDARLELRELSENTAVWTARLLESLKRRP